MSNEYVWQPKDDQENAILAAANHLLRFGHPPVGERLCRRVPAPQGQGVSVPLEVLEAIQGAILSTRLVTTAAPKSERETIWAALDKAQQWLNNQRQGQQQEACPDKGGDSDE